MSFERTKSIQEFFKTANRLHENLSIEQEKLLIEKAQAGCQRSLDRIINVNLLWAAKQARGFIGMGILLEDLISVSCQAMIESVKDFDLSKDVKFITYTRFHIQRACNHEVAEHARIVRLPMNKEIEIYKAKIANEDIEEQKRVAIDKPVGDDGNNSLGDLILRGNSLAEVAHDREHMLAVLKGALGKLSERSRKAIEMSYGFGYEYPMPTDSIADELGLTGTRVNQIIRQAEKDLAASAS